MLCNLNQHRLMLIFRFAWFFSSSSSQCLAYLHKIKFCRFANVEAKLSAEWANGRADWSRQRIYGLLFEFGWLAVAALTQILNIHSSCPYFYYLLSLIYCRLHANLQTYWIIDFHQRFRAIHKNQTIAAFSKHISDISTISVSWESKLTAF